jgi:hypothetical protein
MRLFQIILVNNLIPTWRLIPGHTVDISSCPIGGIVLKIDMHVALFDFIDQYS